MVNLYNKPVYSNSSEKSTEQVLNPNSNLSLPSHNNTEAGIEAVNRSLPLKNNGETNVHKLLSSSALNLLKGSQLGKKELIKDRQYLYNSKSIVFNFSAQGPSTINQSLPTFFNYAEKVLRTGFKSISSLISSPVYYNYHDKIVIKLFIFLSPKIDLGYLSLAESKSSSKPIIQTSKHVKKGELVREESTSLHTSILNKELWSEIIQFQTFYSKKILRKNFSPSGPGEFSIKGKNNTIYKSAKNALPAAQLPVLSKLGKVTKVKGTDPRLLSFFNISYKTLEKITFILSTVFKKKIELDIIRLYFPFHDSKILAKVLGSSSNTNKYKFSRMIQKLLPKAVIKNPSLFKNSAAQAPSILPNSIKELKDSTLNLANFSKGLAYNLFSHNKLEKSFSHPDLKKEANLKEAFLSNSNKNNSILSPALVQEGFDIESPLETVQGLPLPSSISGLNVKLAGRLTTQRVIPRYTIQTRQEGSLARGKVNFLEKARFTNKNKRGAYSFTVNISHIL